MEILKKIATGGAALIVLIIVGYNFFDGWLINPPAPRAFEKDGKFWVAEPTSTFMHYVFGSETLHEARQNPSTGQFEFLKNGEWVPVSSKK